ncbi:TPR domain protein putative component of TonB system [Paramagnetospirillum magnetotacticum MS-1]|uniref:protein O-GlcNAc transferase n=1 Tax=Paramagnetospirillum magnetotacticum MS-1 TaxID=272627 RepID=A0A0C2V152_PARME|nr:tetratricopeptide repeat protein [Paramagnetospirillum magnetotacticum]KIL98801.1 TPR domain protein putative component of TonB system [Paramagnetospirillum magnetotacticum MS-1]
MDQETLAKAQAAHRAGNLAAAEPLYAAVLAANPDHVESLYAYGVLMAQTGRLPQSLDSLGKAARLAPDDSRIGRNYALVLQAAGRLPESEREFVRLSDREPDRPEHRFGLGLVVSAQGRFDHAIAHFREGLALAPGDAEARCNLGLACRAAGRLEEAIDAFAKAAEMAPGLAKAHGNLGGALFAAGRWVDAVDAWARALALEPRHADVRSDMGVALAKLGRLDEAVDCFRQASEIDPGNPGHGYNLGRALHDLGRLEEALQSYAQVIALDPCHLSAHLNSGVIFKKAGDYDQALAAYDRVLELDPANGAASLNRGKTLFELGRLEEALEAYTTARNLMPDDADALSELVHLRKVVCDWPGIEAEEEACRRMVADGNPGIDPLVFLSIPASTEEQARCGNLWGRMLCSDRAASVQGVSFAPRNGDAVSPKIKIGYLAADFHNHPVANLSAGIYDRHDRSRFEISAYSLGPDDGSPMRQRLEASFDRFVDLREVASGDAARRIHADGIDILVDLSGFTKNTRPEILACRPAPVQINFLGFPATMGVDWLDYILADAVIAPRDQQEHYAEKLVHLPHSFLPFGDHPPVGEPSQPRAAHGLPEDAFVFCCINNSFKFRPQTFDVWAEILHQVPRGVLWLLDRGPLSRDNMNREMAGRGIDPARLVFAQRVDLAEHMARHRLADLFLDSFPFNAITTASDALWSGLPVLTWMGESFVSRGASSLLLALGLPELVTASPEAYKAEAIRLAREPERLRMLKDRLDTRRQTPAPLFDTEIFTRDLEKAYVQMVARSRAGLPPEPFAV